MLISWVVHFISRRIPLEAPVTKANILILLEISVDIQRKIARMFYDLLNNYEHLCNLYYEDNQIIDEYCKKYNFNYNIKNN